MAAKKHHRSAIVAYLSSSADLAYANLPTLRNVLCQCQLLRERYIGAKVCNYSVTKMALDVFPLFLGIYERAHAENSHLLL